MRCFSVVVGLLALGCCCVQAQDGELKLLRWGFSPGTKLRLEVRLHTAMEGKGGPGMNMSNDRTTTYELKIGEASGEGRFKAVFTTVKDDVRSGGKSLAASTEPSSLGVVVDTRGRLIEVAEADPELPGQTELPRAELELGLLGGLSPLPEEEVRVGSTWTRKLEGRPGASSSLPVPVVLTNRIEKLGADGTVEITQTAELAPGAKGPPGAKVEWKMTFVVKRGLLESSDGGATLAAKQGERSMTVEHTAKRKQVE